ncbi:hypothetical protein N7455_003771, partial [Penicillium solitum]|uniref:uncharacterized protein n=1 Tax=Penicillium solitum TaxID=60172 RepID=UPI0032C3F299
KAIFEVLWHRQPAVAKRWTPSEFQRFSTRSALSSIRSSLRPTQQAWFVLVLIWLHISPHQSEGGAVTEEMGDVSAYQEECIYQEVSAAVNALQVVGIVWTDPVLGRGPPPITIAARRTSPPFPTPQQQSTSLPPLHNPTPSSLFGLLYIGHFASC